MAHKESLEGGENIIGFKSKGRKLISLGPEFKAYRFVKRVYEGSRNEITMSILGDRLEDKGSSL